MYKCPVAFPNATLQEMACNDHDRVWRLELLGNAGKVHWEKQSES